MPVHDHGWDQLAYASDGFLTVEVPGATWVVPPERGVWVPAGTAHALVMRTRTTLQAVYFGEGVADLPPTAHVVRTSALAREVIRTIIERGMLDTTVPSDARLVGVLVDQLQALDVPPLELRPPLRDPGRRAAELLRADPARDLDELAREMAVSRRTLERSFQQDTGLTLGRWRQRARLLRALELLADGESVTATSIAVGYASPSAFVLAFRNALDATPARYFADA